MAIECMTEVWRHSNQRGTTLLVLLALANRARSEDGLAWPGESDIAHHARLSSNKRQVRYHLQKLVEADELEIVHRPGKTSLYRLNLGVYKTDTPRQKPTVVNSTLRQKPAAPLRQNSAVPVRQKPAAPYNDAFETSVETSVETSSKTPLSAKADRVLSHWREKYHPKARLTADRKRKVTARLRSYSPEQLIQVTDHICSDPWWRGQNDRSTDFSFPEHFMKNDGQVDRFLEDLDGSPSNGRAPPLCRECGQRAPLASPDGSWLCHGCARGMSDYAELVRYNRELEAERG